MFEKKISEKDFAAHHKHYTYLFDAQEKRISELTLKIEALLKGAPSSLTKEEKASLIDLETKLAKLYSMLIDVSSSNGKEKVTKLGRKIYGGKRL